MKASVRIRAMADAGIIIEMLGLAADDDA